MDKELVNTQIVLMRKIVRNVKRFVYQKVLKQMKVLQIKQNKKQNKEIVTKLKHKIENKRQELIAIKGVNVDNVSKQALLNDRTHFENLIKSNKSNFDERAIARIAIHENVVNAVNKFKEENPNCELWLPSQIELWQQKKLMKRNKILKKKNSLKENNSKNEEINQIENELIVNNDNNDIENENKSKLESKSRKTKEKVNKRNKKAVVKRIELKSNDSQIISSDEDIDNEAENDESLETDKNDDKKNIQSKVDPFFLSNNLEINDQKSDEDIEEEVAFNRNKKFSRSKDLSKRKESKFSKTNDKIKSKSTNYQKFQNNDFDKRQNKNSNKFKDSKTTKESEEEISVKKSEKSGSKSEKMHPSWAAKRLMNQKLKISFDQKPIAKKIKFDD